MPREGSERRICERDGCDAQFLVLPGSRKKFCSGKCCCAVRDARKKVPCARCGAMMWCGPDAAETPTCRSCRRIDAARRAERVVRICAWAPCGNQFEVKASNPKIFCSNSCGRRNDAAAKGFDPVASAERRRSRNKARSRARKLRHAESWDGVTDAEILERDGWRCQIPQCKYRRRVIRRDARHPDPRSASVDHIVPLAEGGADTAVNKRASHLLCNVSRGNRGGDDQLALFGVIGDAHRLPASGGTGPLAA